jgi:SHS2 domain-containing protein
MPYEIIDDISRADIAYRVHGKDPDELFASGAAALVSIMLQNPETIRPSTVITFNCESPVLDLLYFDFLSEFIFYKDSKKLILLPESVQIKQSNDGYYLACRAHGETIDRKRHIFNVDIKAVTMHNLIVVQRNNEWTAIVVLDV